MSNEWNTFLERLHELRDLSSAAAVLEWDMQVNLPPGAAEGRGCQLEALAGVLHAKLSDKAFVDSLEAAEKTAYEPESFEGALLRKVRRDYEKERVLPEKLVRALSSASSAGYGAWMQAKQKNDFSIFAPHLERLLELRREQSALFPAAHPLDPLLDDYEEGLTVAAIDPVFAILRKEQGELVRDLAARKRPDAPFLKSGGFSPAKQWKLSEFVARKLGYDFRRGRIDATEHPFTTSFGLTDVRITTKVFPHLPLSCLFSTVHEAGHAIYEQGIDPKFDRTPLADGASLGFHESQSRLWENQVARSLPFWRWFYPVMRKRFAAALGDVSLEEFYRAVNRVEPSLIRIEADEATYNLHIILRYELEKKLLDGTLTVAELPEAWNAAMQELLGVTPPENRLGVLQDVHWSSGGFGYFPTYALGNLIAAQIWGLAEKALPGLEGEIASGNFAPLREFLRENVYRHGAALPPAVLLKRLTGSETVDPQPFLNYLRRKFNSPELS